MDLKVTILLRKNNKKVIDIKENARKKSILFVLKSFLFFFLLQQDYQLFVTDNVNHFSLVNRNQHKQHSDNITQKYARKNTDKK